MDKATLHKLMAKFPCKWLDTGNIRTCPARLSYPNLFEKSKSDGEFASKYGATLLFPKGADLKLLTAAIKAIAIEEWGNNVNMKSLRTPFRDQGEKVGSAGYEDGAFFFRANSDFKPGILGQDGRPVTDPAQIYPGCVVIATVRPFAFDVKGKGVAFGLQNIAKIADAAPFGGVNANPIDEFSDVLDGSGDLAAMYTDSDAAEEDRAVEETEEEGVF